MDHDKDFLLEAVRDEMRRAIGFDGETDSSELQYSRLTALEYYKADMARDMPSLPGRSSAVDTVIADTIHQAIPQICEIFLEEDVAGFRPTNAQDIDQAQIATDYINHVCFQQNRAFEYLTSVVHDGLLLKTGYLVWEWVDPPEPEQQTLENIGPQELINAGVSIQAGKATVVDFEKNDDGTYNMTLADAQKEGRVSIKSWPPEDVAVSTDTIKIGDGTYCGFRSRVRRNELIADGYDPEIVAALPRYGAVPSEVSLARDQAGEYEESIYSSEITGMDIVQVYYHYYRYTDEDGKTTLYKIVSGGLVEDDETLLKVEEANSVPASSFCPFPTPHRHYGESFADLLAENQRIKTSLLRSGLDSIYFSLMGRVEVAEEGVSKNTIPDLMNNIPGGIVRTKTIGSVAPISQMNVQSQGIFQALEYMATAAEQKSGVLRSTMGLNADSLHETRGGMLSMMNMGQTRIRWIARTFAEGAIRDMILGVYDMIRTHATMQQIVRLNGQFVPIDPTNWDARDEVEIDVANAGGRDYDVAGLQQILELMDKAVQAQQGPNGPLLNAGNLVYTARMLTKRLGRKDADAMWPEPQQAVQMAQAAAQAHAQQPSPEAAKAQADAQAQAQQLQLQAQKQQTDAALAAQEQQHRQSMEAQRFAFETAQAQAQAHLAQQESDRKAMLEQYKIESESANKRYQIDQEIRLKSAEIGVQAHLDTAAMKQDGVLETHKMALDHVIDKQKADQAAMPKVELGGAAG